MRHIISRAALALAIAVTAFPIISIADSAPALAQQTSSINRGPSGLPLPRFVSLKSKRVNMRVGPGKDYAVSWMYMKAGLPLEIVQEYDNWRRVRDADGTMGWIHGSLLSGNRTAVATPWRKDAKEETITVFEEPRGGAAEIAYLQPGVITDIDTCDGAWCKVEVVSGSRTLSGFASQVDLWGAYPDEKIDD